MKNYILPKEELKKLMLKNSGEVIICDPADFELAKHVHWYEIKGEIVNRELVTYEAYVGITAKRKKNAVRRDMRRHSYN